MKAEIFKNDVCNLTRNNYFHPPFFGHEDLWHNWSLFFFDIRLFDETNLLTKEEESVEWFHPSIKLYEIECHLYLAEPDVK